MSVPIDYVVSCAFCDAMTKIIMELEPKLVCDLYVVNLRALTLGVRRYGAFISPDTWPLPSNRS